MSLKKVAPAKGWYNYGGNNSQANCELERQIITVLTLFEWHAT